MENRRFNCLIFDFDGTLADTQEGIIRTFQETIRIMGLPVPDRERVKSTIGLALKDGLQAGVDGMSDEQATEACVIYRRIFPEIAIPCITAFEGAGPLLSQLKEKGYRLAVATSRSHHSLDSLINRLGFDGFFEGLYGAEDVVNHKPAPDLVLLILKEFGISPDEVLVIGDATYDLLMGQAAGCRVCGVTWGNQSREKLQSVNPDHIISSFKELLDIV